MFISKAPRSNEYFSGRPVEFPPLDGNKKIEKLNGSKISAANSPTFDAMVKAGWISEESNLTDARWAAILSEIGAMDKDEALRFAANPNSIITSKRISEVLKDAKLQKLAENFSSDISFSQFRKDFQAALNLLQLGLDKQNGVICGGARPPSDVDIFLSTGAASR